MGNENPTRRELLQRTEELQTRLAEAEETLHAIRVGEVDAILVSGPEGEKVFTLEGAEQSYRILVETMNEGTVTLLRESTIAYCNNRFAEMVKLPLETVMGTSFNQFLRTPQEPLLRALLEHADSKGSKAEFTLLAYGGSLVPVKISVRPLEDKHAGAFCLVVTDLTEQKAAEAEIRGLNARLERRIEDLEAANKELEAFSYSVSHDLRAPLRAMDGFCQAVVEDYSDKLDFAGKCYLQRIRSASQRMDQLVNGILGLTRTARSEIRRARVDMSALARTIGSELKNADPKRQVKLVIAPGLIVNADFNLLRSALENLLGNAWKFTGKHSEARIEVGVIQLDGQNVYFVRDDGAGFDKTYSSKLFGAFQRLHTEAEFEGTGIGLATVQRIIRRHGGQVWAEGAVEKGATFFFTLPTSFEEAQYEEQDRAAS